MFFAFASLYPEMQVRLMGILLLKVKWLAWLDTAMFAFDIVSSLLTRQWITAVLPVVAHIFPRRPRNWAWKSYRVVSNIGARSIRLSPTCTSMCSPAVT